MSKVSIDCPYLNQYDNQLYPGGSCNMTSLGMALEHYKRPVAGPYKRTPDNLLHFCDTQSLDRHDLTTIAKVSQHFGLGDNASFTGTLEQGKKHLQTGNLVIVQGTFTPSGHVMVWCGFDEEKDLIQCNDPAGVFENGHYNGYASGEGVWYPSAWWDSHAAPDGSVWIHRLHL